MLWDLLHEYGHHIDKDLSNKGRTARECRAWQIARELLINDGFTASDLIDFDLHMNNKLNTYRTGDLHRWKDRNCLIVFKDGTKQHGFFKILMGNKPILMQISKSVTFDSYDMLDVRPPEN